MSTETLETVTQNSGSTEKAEVRFDENPRPLVYVGASAYEWKAECHFFDSMVNAMSLCRAQISKDWGVGDAASGRKRNFQAHRFLTQTKAEFLFFIDSDIVFEPV